MRLVKLSEVRGTKSAGKHVAVATWVDLDYVLFLQEHSDHEDLSTVKFKDGSFLTLNISAEDLAAHVMGHE